MAVRSWNRGDGLSHRLAASLPLALSTPPGFTEELDEEDVFGLEQAGNPGLPRYSRTVGGSPDSSEALCAEDAGITYRSMPSVAPPPDAHRLVMSSSMSRRAPPAAAEEVLASAQKGGPLVMSAVGQAHAAKTGAAEGASMRSAGQAAVADTIAPAPLPPFPFMLEPRTHFKVPCACGEATVAARVVSVVSKALSTNGVDFQFEGGSVCSWKGVKYAVEGFYVDLRVRLYGVPVAEKQHRDPKLTVEFNLSAGDRLEFRRIYGEVRLACEAAGCSPAGSERGQAQPRLAPLFCAENGSVSSNRHLLTPPPMPMLARASSSGSLAMPPPPALASSSSLPPIASWQAHQGLPPGAGLTDEEIEEQLQRADSPARRSAATTTDGDMDEDVLEEDLKCPLLSMLQSPNLDTREEGCRLIASASSQPGMQRAAIACPRLVGALAGVIRSAEDECRRADCTTAKSPACLVQRRARAFAVFALSNLSECIECHALIKSTGLGPELFALATGTAAGVRGEGGCPDDDYDESLNESSPAAGAPAEACGCPGTRSRDTDEGASPSTAQTSRKRLCCGPAYADLEVRREASRSLANLCASFGDAVLVQEGEFVSGDAARWLRQAEQLRDERLRAHALRIQKLVADDGGSSTMASDLRSGAVAAF